MLIHFLFNITEEKILNISHCSLYLILHVVLIPVDANIHSASAIFPQVEIRVGQQFVTFPLFRVIVA